MLNMTSIEKCSEDTDSAISPVLLLLDKRMKHLEINTGTVGVGHNVGTSENTTLENKWEGNMREVAVCINGMDIFSGGRWFRSQIE